MPANNNYALEQQILQQLGSDAQEYIALQRIQMMLAMSKNNVHDATLMAFGYIIQMLTLVSQNQPGNEVHYMRELETYRARLNAYAAQHQMVSAPKASNLHSCKAV